MTSDKDANADLPLSGTYKPDTENGSSVLQLELSEIDIDQPPSTTLEFALRVKLEALRSQYRNRLYFGLGGIFAAGLVAIVAITVNKNIKTSIETNYEKTAELITEAYRGDRVAHAEVVRRFPVLLKGRLPKTLKRLQNSPIVKQGVSDNLALKAKTSEEPMEIIPLPEVSLYADRSDESHLLGVLQEGSIIGSIRNRGEWSSIKVDGGVPVWIAAKYVQELGGNELRVSASRVGLRARPEQPRQLIVTVVDTDDSLDVIQKQGEWYQVKSPENFVLWVKTTDLESYTRAIGERQQQVQNRLARGVLVEQSGQEVVETKTESPSSTLVVTKLPEVRLFQDRSELSHSLGKLPEKTNVSLIERRGSWSSIRVDGGVPLWIAARYVVESSPDEVRVSASRVGLRVRPEQSKLFIVSVVDTDDALKVIEKLGDWYKVQSPENFAIWARSAEFDSYNQAITEQQSLNTIQKAVTQENGFRDSVPQGSPLRERVPRETSSQEAKDLESNIIPTVVSASSPPLKLYSSNSEQSIVLGRIGDDSEIISIKRRGAWSRIMMSTGVPLWISKVNAEKLDSTLIRVVGQGVGLRISPRQPEEFIVTMVNEDDTLQLLQQNAEWFQVNSPADFQAWVKTEHLERMIEQ